MKAIFKKLRGESPSLKINIFANYVGKFIGIVSIYLFIPLYIKILGISAYGLVAFYSTAAALVYIADAGLSSSFSREISKNKSSPKNIDLLVSIERALYVILIIVLVLMFFFASDIARVFIRVDGEISNEIIVDCIRLMSFAIVPQVAVSLYHGGLMGLEKQLSANSYSTIYSLLRSGLVLLPIYLLPDIRIFFIWQIIISWCFLLFLRGVLIRKLIPYSNSAGNFSWKLICSIRGYAAGMFLMSIIAGLNTQIDKLIVSNLESLNNFTFYTLATNLAQIPVIITMPIALAILPRLTELLQNNGLSHKAKDVYYENTYLIASLASVASFSLFFFGKNILSIWLGGVTYPDSVIVAIQILSIGSLFLSLQLTPFQLSLANGHNKTNVIMGLMMLIFIIPMGYLLTKNYGLIGASIPWLFLNFIAFFYLGFVLNVKFNHNNYKIWLVNYNLPPLFLAFFFLFSAKKISELFELSNLVMLVFPIAFSMISLAASYLFLRIIKHNIYVKNFKKYE